jgi:hypothetical protein
MQAIRIVPVTWVSRFSSPDCIDDVLKCLRQRPHDELDSDEDIVKSHEGDETSRLDSAINTGNASHDDAFLLPTRTSHYRQHCPTRRRFLTGWRIGAVAVLSVTILVFIFYAAYTIYVSRSPWNYPVEGSVATLFSGSCAKTRSMNVWAHFLINTLSTLLLVASNYCMQVLASPNRAEVRAHMQWHWLHIGVPNMRNLKYIGKDRVAIWVFLFLSPMPLHLLFNSVVFTILQANEYVVVPTMKNWLYGAPYNTSRLIDGTDANNVNESYPSVL